MLDLSLFSLFGFSALFQICVLVPAILKPEERPNMLRYHPDISKKLGQQAILHPRTSWLLSICLSMQKPPPARLVLFAMLCLHLLPEFFLLSSQSCQSSVFWPLCSVSFSSEEKFCVHASQLPLLWEAVIPHRTWHSARDLLNSH